jgi:hypothetical protein
MKRILLALPLLMFASVFAFSSVAQEKLRKQSSWKERQAARWRRTDELHTKVQARDLSS